MGRGAARSRVEDLEVRLARAGPLGYARSLSPPSPPPSLTLDTLQWCSSTCLNPSRNELRNLMKVDRKKEAILLKFLITL